MLTFKGKNVSVFNTVAAITLAILVAFFLYQQVSVQLSHISTFHFRLGSNVYPLAFTVFWLMGMGLEITKWYVLVNYSDKQSYLNTAASYFAGCAFATLTPGGMGDFPGRVLYLTGSKKFATYVSPAILAVASQYTAITFLACVALIAAPPLFAFQSPIFFLFGLGIIALLVISLFFLPLLRQVKKIITHPAAKINKAIHLFQAVPVGLKTKCLTLSLSRILINCLQLLCLLSWLGLSWAPWQMLPFALLYFAALTAIPSFALADLGIRGSVALVLFHHFSPDTISILTATLMLWFSNVMIPALAGIVALFRINYFSFGNKKVVAAD